MNPKLGKYKGQPISAHYRKTTEKQKWSEEFKAAREKRDIKFKGITLRF